MRIFLIALTICLFALPAFSETVYTLVTKDAEVTSVDDVRVKVATPVTQEQTWTLRDLDAQKTQIEANIVVYQGQIAQWQQLLVKIAAMRTAVLKEAEKVQLKAAEEPK